MTKINNRYQIQEDILASIERNLPRIGNRNPMIGNGAPTFDWHYPDEYFWTDSFWTGQLWLAYSLTGEEKFKNSARMRREQLEKILSTPMWIDHDMGFLFSLTAVADYKLTGCNEARDQALRAAEALRNRFNWNGRYLPAWNAQANNPGHAEFVQGKIIIDCMQNLGLLLWAYKETNVESFKEVALQQADTSLKHLVRDDFSTYHSFNFDPRTNEPVEGKTVQGFADESCWSRGHAWAVHGFAQLAETTGNLEYADISAKLTDYVIENITDDCIPVWDYSLPASHTQYKDTSAGAVTASGIYILADVYKRAGREEEAKRYHAFAEKMLTALRTHHDLTEVEHAEGLLSGAASFVNMMKGPETSYLADGMLPYGDYYYFEAAMRSVGHNQFFWN
ncbi:glycoside hydrolase family 88 protein [Vibrio superstes]|uniref:Glucuronyl hydrolase n=1 Tax=Vibrio superstes NBRC 103154 TaxID=1219062 RepID=A0A511QQD7_9VIBR|nr:glycoside hydrolase family 88 protein [Vibrio superstes]GEM79116.1 glucuronyl hydrolase [Vibrio superstes NBRC 103154]